MSPSPRNRAETTGHWSVPGDEHALPILVLLPTRSLQQENVRGVQAAGCGGWKGGIQVGEEGQSGLSWEGSEGKEVWFVFFVIHSRTQVSCAPVSEHRMFSCSQVRSGVPFQILQLWAGEEIPARHI